MDFELTTEQQELRDAARKYATQQLPVHADRIEQTGSPPDRALKREFGSLGFLGVNLPERYGGLGLGNLEALLVLEEFARISSAVAFPVFESSVGPIRAIVEFGQESLKERIVPQVCAGEVVVAIAMSEPGAGTALTDLTTRAEFRSDHIEINGTKRWCSGGGMADGYLVYVRMSDKPGAAGIGAIYVEAGTPGLSFGLQEVLMGFRGIPSADLHFDNVKVPLENLVVSADGGFRKLMQVFDLERCGNATMSLAQASAAVDDVLAYVGERRQFGRPIIEFQGVQLKLAEMKMQAEAARLLIYRAASNAQRDLPSVLDSSLAKCFANEAARTVTGTAIQLLGGYGYSKEYPLERRFRDAWGWGIAGGTIDIQKVNIASAMAGRRFNQRST